MSPLLDRILEGRRFVRVARHPSGLSCAARLMPPNQVARGYEDAYSVGADTVVTAKNLAFERGFEEIEPGCGRMVFCVHLKGHRVIEVANIGRYELKSPSFVAFYQAPGVSKRSIWLSGREERSVMAGFAPSHPPVQEFGARALAAAIRQDLDLHRQPFVWLCAPLDIQTEMVGRALAMPMVHSDLLPTYLRLKAKELICLGLNRLISLSAARSNKNLIGQCEDALLIEVCRIVEDGINRPLSAAGLADSIGIAPNELRDRFREAYGITLADYIISSRMEQARLLVEESDYKLKEIAFRTGYRHLSNFCIGYKRYFGLTPREARRRERAN
jgi:AraC-like DNA-binding protein